MKSRRVHILLLPARLRVFSVDAGPALGKCCVGRQNLAGLLVGGGAIGRSWLGLPPLQVLDQVTQHMVLHLNFLLERLPWAVKGIFFLQADLMASGLYSIRGARL